MAADEGRLAEVIVKLLCLSREGGNPENASSTSLVYISRNTQKSRFPPSRE